MTVLSAETHLSFRVLTYSLGNVHCWRIVLGQGLIAVPLGSFLSCKLSASDLSKHDVMLPHSSFLSQVV